MADAHLPATCGKCGTTLRRLYSFQRPVEFRGYDSVELGDGERPVHIDSRTKEKRLMREKGLIFAADTKQFGKFREDRKRKRRKRVYSA